MRSSPEVRDKEVRVGNLRGVEVAAEIFPRRPGRFLPGLDGGGIIARSVGHLGARAVVECQHQRPFREILGRLDDPVQFALDVLGQRVGAADGEQADAVLDQVVQFALQEIVEEAHQAGNLLGGAFPVFDREGVQGDVADADRPRGVHDGADGFHAAAMAFQARQSTLFRPPAVAVHDDGHVLRNFGQGQGTACGRRRYRVRRGSLTSRLRARLRRAKAVFVGAGRFDTPRPAGHPLFIEGSALHGFGSPLRRGVARGAGVYWRTLH